nr:YncE family protein [Chloroflexota bacterium]
MGRALICILSLFAVLFLLASCVPTPVPSTPTPTVKAPTQGASPTLLPTATALPSPTFPDRPYLIGEIPLRSLRGVGHAPQAIVILNGRVYVANRSTNNVSVIEGNRVSAVIPVGDKPVALAADAKTGFVYVANEGNDSLSIISSDQVVKTVPTVKSPACLAAWDGRVYVGGRGENVLRVLDGFSGERIGSATLPAPIGILALTVNPATRLLYASVYDSVQIVSLETMTIVAQLKCPVYLTLEADPVHGGFLVGEYDAVSNTSYLVNYAAFGQQEMGRVPIGGDPRGIAVNPQNGRIYVANSWTNDVSVIDGGKLQLVATVPVGLRPWDVAVDEKGRVYVVNADSENVVILDGETNQLHTVVPLALLPRDMAVDENTGRLYIACASTNSVFVLQDQRVTTEVSVGLHPIEVAVDAKRGQLFVLNHVSGDLSVISMRDNRVVKTVNVGSAPQGLAVASEAARLYASDAVLDADSQRVLRNIELLTTYGSVVKPVQIELDAKSGRAYMVAHNGIPGSNGGFIIYVMDLTSGELIPGAVGGLSTTDMVLDSEGQLVFSTAGRFGRFQLIINDAIDFRQVAVVDLPKYPAALAYNPKTHHVFLCLTTTSDPTVEPGPQLWILDSRGFGTVAQLRLPGEPGQVFDPYDMTVDVQRGYVYIADRERGTVHVLRDALLPPPPTPTPTHTPTPWPTLTPQPEPSLTATIIPEPSCQRVPGPPFAGRWMSEPALRLGLGCPTEEMQGGFIAEQPFERGYMIWREADRNIFVLYNDGQWHSFADQWQEGMPEYSCTATPPGGFLQPKRGFGLVWCAQRAVKEGLGWANTEERGNTTEWQAFERGQMIRSRIRPVVYVLFADGSFLEYPDLGS